MIERLSMKYHIIPELIPLYARAYVCLYGWVFWCGPLAVWPGFYAEAMGLAVDELAPEHLPVHPRVQALSVLLPCARACVPCSPVRATAIRVRPQIPLSHCLRTSSGDGGEVDERGSRNMADERC